MNTAGDESRDEVRSTSFRERGSSTLDEIIFRFRSRRILREFPRVNGVVLADFGSGYDARFASMMKRGPIVRHAFAVDLSLDPRLEEREVQSVIGDLNQKIPMESSSADIATSLAVIEHLTDPATHCRELHRILRPGGTLLLTTPSKLGKPVLEFLAYRLHLIDEHEIRDHKTYYDEKGLRGLLADAGFDPKLVTYGTFLFGMNQIVVAKR